MPENTGNTLLQTISFYYYMRALHDMRSLSRNLLHLPHEMHVLARKMAYTANRMSSEQRPMGAGAVCGIDELAACNILAKQLRLFWLGYITLLAT